MVKFINVCLRFFFSEKKKLNGMAMKSLEDSYIIRSSKLLFLRIESQIKKLHWCYKISFFIKYFNMYFLKLILIYYLCKNFILLFSYMILSM